MPASWCRFLRDQSTPGAQAVLPGCRNCRNSALGLSLRAKKNAEVEIVPGVLRVNLTRTAKRAAVSCMRFANRRRSCVKSLRTSLNIRSRVTMLLRRSPGRSVRPTIVFRRLPQNELGARLRFSLSSSPKHMTPTFPRYRSSEGCSSSGTEPSLLGHNHCHMLISTKKKP